jgi:hypothetical protein
MAVTLCFPNILDVMVLENINYMAKLEGHNSFKNWSIAIIFDIDLLVHVQSFNDCGKKSGKHICGRTHRQTGIKPVVPSGYNGRGLK